MLQPPILSYPSVCELWLHPRPYHVAWHYGGTQKKPPCLSMDPIGGNQVGEMGKKSWASEKKEREKNPRSLARVERGKDRKEGPGISQQKDQTFHSQGTGMRTNCLQPQRG